MSATSSAEVRVAAPPRADATWNLAYAGVIFLSAFLLFQVQVLLGKYILPWFGGSASVWTTCMLFFQALLLVGYAYAHWLTRFNPAVQARVHSLLIGGSVLALAVLGLRWAAPILPGAGWKPPSGDSPIAHIIAVLAVGIGYPFFLLSSTSPLLQHWLHVARGNETQSAYKLYSASNLGSLLGLVSYPFIVEPLLALPHQAWMWSAAYVVFAGSIIACARQMLRGSKNAPAEKPKSLSKKMEKAAQAAEAAASSPIRIALWFLLAACGSAMLLATTNLLCQDIAVIPLLWVVPLCIYLLTFILCFHSDRWYRRGFFHAGFGAMAAVVLNALFLGGLLPLIYRILVFLVALFFCCMVCHGELTRLRPNARRLTLYYLTIAAGGAGGSAFISLVAPHIFPDFWEFQFVYSVAATLVVAVLLMQPDSWLRRKPPWQAIAATLLLFILPIYVAMNVRIQFGPNPQRWSAEVLAIMLVALLATRPWRKRNPSGPLHWAQLAPLVGVFCFAAMLLMQIRNSEATALARVRNFYGVLKVIEHYPNDPLQHNYQLLHGRVVHGIQLAEPEYRRRVASYYIPKSGIGLALTYHPRRWSEVPEQRNLRVGVIGLGIGTVAGYGIPGDYFRFYEINPAVVGFSSGADPFFTYLKDSRAKIDIESGDGRISLQRERDAGELQRFDILLMDAFSGDAVPVHLLTREAFTLYLEHLRDNSSILAVNVTNANLNLEPVVAGLARYFGMHGLVVSTPDMGDTIRQSRWILLSRNNPVLTIPDIHPDARELIADEKARLWTDEYSNLVSLIKH